MNLIRHITGLILVSGLINIVSAQQEFPLVSVSADKSEITFAQDKEQRIVLTAKITSGWHINSNKPKEDFLIPTTVEIIGAGIRITGIRYPEPVDAYFSFSSKAVSVYEGEVDFIISLRQDTSFKTGSRNIEIRLYYQACNDRTCLAPESVSAGLVVRGADKSADDIINDSLKSISPLMKVDSLNLRDKTDPELSDLIPGSGSDDTISSMIQSSGLFLSLIFIFIAGLALNLTPCIYPLIPITIGYFGGQSEGKTGRLALMGLLFMLGMAVTYSIVGVVTSLTGAVFGAMLQNTVVIIVIAGIFIVLALSMFGFYEFKLPDRLVTMAGGAKGGFFGAFFMGLTMGIVAAPCIGPFVLGLVTYVAMVGDPFYGFLMFFVLALGLGLPYLFLAIFSGKIKNLPRAGLWMEGVKHIFGFLLIGMALYFLTPILPEAFQSYTLPLFGIVTGIILLFIDRTANGVKGFRIFKMIFSVLVVALSVYMLLPQEKAEAHWSKFSVNDYEFSLNNNEKMVIDFYADWCIPCKELDALTFSDSRVSILLEDFTTYKVDMTKNTTENENIRKAFNVVGMPTVLIIDSEGNELSRITGFVNADEFLKLIKNVN